MVWIFTEKLSPRLQYICDCFFTDVYKTPYQFTIDSIGFESYAGAKINYSALSLRNCVQIVPHTLLFENDITAQQIDIMNWECSKAFFATPGDWPFDLFAASFYLMSRYEEYLPHQLDSYGRFDTQVSLAYRQGFLHLPLVNIWLAQFIALLKKQFQFFEPQAPKFMDSITFDIDSAFAFKHKGLLRSVGGLFKQPSLVRLKCLMGLQKDPFDIFDTLHQQHQQYAVCPTFFFLVADKNSIYDKHVLPQQQIMWRIVKKHAKVYPIGIHPSWQSNAARKIVAEELNTLSDMADMPINKSRQHYIKMTMPITYQNLIRLQIEDDFSMGYGSVNGFRASIASSHYWFDLSKNESTNLKLHPFCFMDATAHYEEGLKPDTALIALQKFRSICIKYGLPFVSIWHNSILSKMPEFKGWNAVYIDYLKEIAGFREG